MIHGKTARALVLVSILVALLFLHQTGPAIAQADKFQEDMQKGEAALTQRKYEAAVDAYRSAVRDSRALNGVALSTASATANLGLSKAYLGLGAFKSAIQSCDEALKHTGASKILESMVRNQRGLAIVASVTKPADPKLEEAVTEFRKVLELTDQDPIVSYNLGTTLLKLKRDAEGVHELQAFVARAGRTPEADAARRMIAEPRRARENFAPDFSLTTSDGEFITLEELKGKVVLLDFWGSWCPPCRESTPSLVRYQKKHSSEVFVMVGVAVNEASAEGWRDYIEKNKLVWPQYLDSTRKISSLFKVTAFPTYITIDAEGIVRDRRTGWNGDTMTYIDEQVKKAVKARATSPPPELKPAPRPTASAAAPATSATIPTPPTVPSLSPVTITSSTMAMPAPTPGNSNPGPGVAVRGHVTLLPGASPNLRVNLIQPGTPPTTVSMLIGPDGLFEFRNVRPGNYSVSMSTPVPVQPIIVGTEDVNGIEFLAPPVRTISGKAIIDGAGAAPAGLRLAFTVIHPNGTVGIGPIVQADGSFSVLMPVGEHRLALNVPGYSMRSMVFGSIDLLREPLKLTSTDTAQLIVTLAANGSRGAGPAPGFGANGALLGEPVGAAAVMTEPILIAQGQPTYTNEARQARLEGTVTLQATVRKDGTVDDIVVTQGLGLGLDEQAIATLRQYRFRPATRNGQPVDARISLLVNFRLAR